MTRIERFCRDNTDAPDRIALAYYQMRFWEEKRRSHQMKHGFLSAAMFESKLRSAGKTTASEFKRRVRHAVYMMHQQDGSPLGKPVLP